MASASPWRRKILADAGVSFTVEKSGYKENMRLKLAPTALAKKLALGKALAVAKRHKDAIVIGADTFVTFEGKILGKPGTSARARAMLKALSGKSHSLLTGFAIVDSKTGEHVVRTVSTRLVFRKLSREEIEEYVRTGEPLHVAGGYAIQGGGSKFIKSIHGDFDNVAGLPLKEVLHKLHEFCMSYTHPEGKSILTH